MNLTIDTGVAGNNRPKLSEAKQALLERRLRTAAAQTKPAPKIRARELSEAPLSFEQDRLWFLEQLEPNSPLYTMPLAFRLTGTLNREALENSLSRIVQRHQVLRTRFVSVNGEPRQQITSSDKFILPVVELRGRSETEINQRLAEEAQRPFDLSNDLMLRAALFRVAEHVHVLFLNMHHIASDGWSWAIFLRELTELYDGFVNGRDVALAELPIQYADYAMWERDQLRDGELKEQLVYWRRHLEGAPALLELPADRRRPAAQSFSGAREALTLPAELNEKLNALARREGVTLYLLLLTAFNILLHRYTRREDLIVGTPVAGRTESQCESLIGFFVRTLVVRSDLSGQPTFRELLRRTNQVMLDAYAHQDVPFEKLVEELRPARSPGFPPLVQIMFAFQNAPALALNLPQLEIQPVEIPGATAKFDLTLFAEEDRGQLRLAAEYSQDLFNSETIARLLQNFEVLLRGISERPDQRISELPLLAADERQKLLAQWMRNARSYPRETTIGQQFEAQVKRTPHVIAVESGQSRLTYAELNERANQLAHHLQSLGVGVDDLVAVFMDRSVDLIVAWLGILKAGGAYVPLDPAQPSERLLSLLEDSRPTVLLTQSDLRRQLIPLNENIRAICLDQEWPTIAQASRSNPLNRATAETLAYVSFTSGSTGGPKGVCVPHRAVIRLVTNTDYLQLQPNDVVAQISNAAFDASTFEIWGALLNGARLQIFPSSLVLSPKQFRHELEQVGVTAMFVTTALFNQLTQEEPAIFSTLQAVLFGGDIVNPLRVAEVLTKGRPARLLHVYGPTESTTFATWHEVQAVGESDKTVPIGRPIANTEVFVLDENLQPVPAGVPGELFLGGDGLARGYLNRPELTAEKFIASPFHDQAGARLYRTGDVVRCRPDGNIEFIGRTDSQIKLRGFRVELGEIETALAQHPGVRECVVTLLGGDAAEKRLVAHVTAAEPNAPSGDELRNFLRTRLPDYMLPTAYVFLPALPLNQNGKVDRAALPAPDLTRPMSDKKFVAPRDALETQVAAIWEEFLSVRPVGVLDNFFDLGGHSLLAVRVLARIEKEMGKTLSAAALFQSPTLGEFTQAIRETTATPARRSSSLVPIQPNGTKLPLFLIHGAGGGMFWGYANLARHLGADQPVYGFRSRGLDGGPEFGTIAEMAAQYVADLREFQPQGPYCLGGYCFGGNVAHEMARQLREQGEEVALLALMNSVPPFSRYQQVVVGRKWLGKFFANVGYLIQWHFRRTPAQRRDFIAWQFRTFSGKLQRLFGTKASAIVNAGELVDLSACPLEERPVWDAHVQALFKHSTQPYPGRVLLLRSRGHQFWCSFDNDYGWTDFVEGGLDVRTVSGAHEQILEEPFVRSIAGELKRALEEVAEKNAGAGAVSSAEGDNLKLLLDWNDTQRDFPVEQTYAQAFEKQAQQTPHALAAGSVDGTLTYAELNQRANQLAHHLRGMGVQTETLVAICLERSLDLLVALLAVLKAGAAYVPLDPSYPKERLRYMLSDSGARVLLTQKTLAAEFRESPAQPVFLDDAHSRELFSRCPQENLPVAATSDNLAYVIYTSGSTGTPKGVQISHRSLLNHNFAVRELYQLTAHDRVLQFSPFSFDISVEEIFPTWLAGGAVVLRTDDALTSPERFLEFVGKEQLSVLNLPTAYWHELVEALDTSDIPEKLRLVVIGGERASEVIYQRWKKRAGKQIALINTYGPTETTVIATTCAARPDDDGTLPIGRPIANTQIFILNADMQPVLPGEIGELYIGGSGLARGYLNRPELTAEKFIPNPFAKYFPSERLYRTGDLARFRPDGNIEFVGREDQQIKIRGYRVELPEIEAVLLSHPLVKEAVVQVREDKPGHKRLAAYFVAREPGLSTGKLREFVKAKLPSHMIPAAFMAIETLPKSPSGKVDYRALPAPSAERQELDEALIAPRTPLEQVLAKIWSEVLEVNVVGVNDNFFDLGGHSLLASQVLSRVRSNLHLEVSLSTLFACPSVSLLAEHLTNANTPTQPVLPVEQIATSKKLPLTPAQQRLWFLDQFEPHQSPYNIPVAIRLSGELNVPILELALTELARRHAALRAVFPVENGKPIQCICEPQPVVLPLTDLSEVSAEARWDKALELMRQEARNPYVLAHPMMRPLLIRLNDRDHVLLLILHQLAADARSVRVLLHELTALYQAFVSDEKSPLPPTTSSYSDTILNSRLSTEAEKSQLEFWTRQLADAPTICELPTDRPRPAHKTDAGARLPIALPKSLIAGVEKLCQTEQVSLSTALLAGFQALLARYTGQTDVIIGSTAPKPAEPGSENLVGQFENLLVLRGDLSGDPDFCELLRRASKTVSTAWEHRALPFEKILEVLQPERDPRYHPVFQIGFCFEDESWPAGEFGGVQFAPFALDNRTSKLALTLHLLRVGESVSGWIEFSTDLFDADRIARLAEHYQVLLAGAVAEPQQPLAALPLLSQKERRQIFLECNNTALEYPRAATLVQLFEEQAARTPEAIALLAGNERFTYAELNARANQLAEELRALGVQPETLVGLCVERSWRMIASILGILKAGGAYVPMDPTYPADRLEFMLADSQAPVLITEEKLLPRFQQDEPTFHRKLFCIDRDWKSLARRRRENFPATATATNLAYVIYTSGSTGRPKGVAIEHRAPVALMHWARQEFSAEEISGVLAATSMCFDLSIFEMFVPLSCGGTIVLVENPLALATSPVAHHVTLINTVPSALRELLRVKGIPASVQVVNLAGEPLTAALADQIYAETTVKKVYDLYGPTETTTYSTGTLRTPGAPATIGRPLANEQVYILDAARQLCPIGVPGELYIGGDGLARGYLHRPDLTAEKFVPHPFKAGERVYKTGDLARWCADGNLEFLGRIDHQVKIRGFRIELGEIESVLRQNPEIAEAVVIAWEHQPGDKRLAAYVVARNKNQSPDRLKSFIKTRLPEHMVPSDIVLLDVLPLTPNGKLDRKALPAIRQTRPAENTFVPARTPLEISLARIWSEVLGIESIGIHDNFFELGGHSLLAIQVVSRIRAEFNVEVPLFSLFDTPTIGALAAGFTDGQWKSDSNPVLPLQPISRGGPLSVSFVQERLWFLDQLQPGGHAYNVPFAVRLRGQLDPNSLQRALDDIVRRHEALRTTFAMANGNLTQVIQESARLELKRTDLRGQPGRENKSREILATESRKSFDLARGPLARVTLVQVENEDHLLILVMHHTISDGWSLAIFFKELQALYNAHQSGRTLPALPELPIQCADHAHWQRQSLSGTALETELAWWKEELAGAPPAVQLPADAIETDSQPEAARTALPLGKEFTASLNKFSQRQGSTPFMVCLTALAITLHKWTQQNDLVLGTVVAGRNRRELENVIGCFMNFLPLRIKLQPDETALAALTRTRATVLNAQAHQDCPFQKIVEVINPKRRTDRNPLYNVGWLLQNFPSQLFASEALTCEAVPIETAAALLDLRFEAEETAQGLSLMCEYKTSLFTRETANQLLTSFQQVLEKLVEQPETKLSAIGITAALDAQAKSSPAKQNLETVAITATFTAEYLSEPFEHWIKELSLPAKMEFAPYGQVFQELLDPNSLLGRNQRGLNVTLIRLEDWEREHDGNGHASAGVERTAGEFVTALKTAAARGSAPHLVCFCPSAKAILQQPERANFFVRLEAEMAAQLRTINGIHVVTTAELFDLYPVKSQYDPQGDDLGHVPYTPAFFTALATMIARRYYALKHPPCKVIALDCDHTLWSGICGEDGPSGIRLDPPRRALQEFMRQQLGAGRLLCLCSKNNEEDVAAVFERVKEMPLQPEHFVTRQINWNPKSANLRALAQELNLGLESFVLVDDNPMECAEVSANCPEVVTLQLPDEPELIPQFLKHCWIFDYFPTTAEDARRTAMYQQNRQREELRRESSSLQDFLAALELEVEITPMVASDLARVSQLTQRTNQFNTTTRRRSEGEIQALIQRDGFEIQTVRVSDRFGDYGLVGVMIFRINADALEVDSFLLSCRVLGKGVEHKLLAQLGKLAQERGLARVVLHFVPSQKNKPARDFLESVGRDFREALNGGFVYAIPAELAAVAAFHPTENVPTVIPSNETLTTATPVARAEKRFDRWRWIALEANDPEKILALIESKTITRTRTDSRGEPETGLEKQLCEIWEELLRISHVGVNDDFFELGGHSFLAVRMFARIETLTGKRLPVVTIFQSPTIKQLAEQISQSEPTPQSPSLILPIQPEGTRTPLFMVHGAGGDVMWGYANLARHLGEDQPVFGLQARASDKPDKFNTLEEMAADYIEELRAFQPMGPYCLGGYCFGGSLAYEMARQLTLAGQSVTFLALIESTPEGGSYEKARWWRLDFPIRFAHNLYFWLGDFLGYSAEERRSLVRRKIKVLGRKFRHWMSGTVQSEAVDLDDIIDSSKFQAHEIQLWDAHLRLLVTHQAKPYPGRVTVFRTAAHPLFSSYQNDLGWGSLVAGVEVKIVAGSHGNIFLEPNVRDLARHLSAVLETASPAVSNNGCKDSHV